MIIWQVSTKSRRLRSSPLWFLSVWCARLQPASLFLSGAFGLSPSVAPRLSRRGPHSLAPFPSGRIDHRVSPRATMATLSRVGHDADDGNHEQRYDLIVCSKCKGEGKLILPATRKARKRHKHADSNQQQQQQRPPPRIDGCKVCQGSGLVGRNEDDNGSQQVLDSSRRVNFPHVAIVGGGLGGLALAVACKHRSIPFTVYERDDDFFQRSQGYGLTMQQASRALKALGIPVPLAEGIVSTKHVVHTPDGSVVGEWGLRKWAGDGDKKASSNMEHQQKINQKNNNNSGNKRQNVHIARQSLRFELLQALGGPSQVQWGHRLAKFTEQDDSVDLVFEISSSQPSEDSSTSATTTITETKHETATLLVGADGIRSSVREQWLGNQTTPLRYLGCIVILGICPLSSLPSDVVGNVTPSLLDGETVFQTADGSTRIYMMPFSKKEYMWQLSFPMAEDDAKTLSRRGPQALKDESLKMCHSWHDPIIPILQTTPAALVSGYPVYDRDLLTTEIVQNQTVSVSPSTRRVTLLGDACHPMSPFKGQGANQALLDALSLARTLYKRFRGKETSGGNKSDNGKGDSDTPEPTPIETNAAYLKECLESFEEEMLARSSVKVKASAEAARFLHTEVAIQEGNVTRGAAANSTCSKSK